MAKVWDKNRKKYADLQLIFVSAVCYTKKISKKEKGERRMQTKQWGNACRTTVVCVDSYDDRVMRGRLYHPHLPEGMSFRSVLELLLLMHGALEPET